MTSVLDAGHVYSSDDRDVVVVGFADSKFDTHRYVLLQRSKSVSDAEKRLGHDQVHISVDDPSRSTYGGIRQVELGRGEVRILVDEPTAAELRTGAELLIRYALADEERVRLFERVMELFALLPQALRVHR